MSVHDNLKGCRDILKGTSHGAQHRLVWGERKKRGHWTDNGAYWKDPIHLVGQ